MVHIDIDNQSPKGDTQLQLVERHIIKPTDKRWGVIDEACFLSKNLWNYANYLWRQAFIKEGQFLSYNYLAKELKQQVDYTSLPRKVSQQVLRQLDQAWRSWSQAIKAYKINPSAFRGRPKLPGYKHKTKGRNKLTYTLQALSKPKLRQGIIKPSGLDIKVKTRISPETINEVRIITQASCYVVEVVYTVESGEMIGGEYVAGVDIGLNNLAAVISNQPGSIPFLINGRPLKTINQYYNKQKAQLQSQLPPELKSSHRIHRLTHKRNMKINDYLHKASCLLIEWCAEQGIGTLVVGKNDGWKQSIDIGKRNNQNFVSIPHARFIQMLQYKGELAGIKVIVTEESYTSKCSSLDNEVIQKHEQYQGKRIKRGLFRSQDGTLLNADINGAANIIRKAVPNAFANGIEGVVVHPLLVLPA